VLAHEFVRNALLAGFGLALGAGAVGWFVVARAQVFAADALSHAAFVGALGAAAVAVDERVGLFALTLALAALVAALGRRARADDATIGVVFTWVLGIGVLLIGVLARSATPGSAVTVAGALFGSLFALTAGQAAVAALVGVGALLALAAIARPLLYASLDAELAALQGVPVRALGVALLVLLGALTAEGTQAIGALLVLGLIAAPAGAALRVTPNPWAGMALSAAIALAAMWGGVVLAYAVPSLPPSTAIVALLVLAYALAALLGRVRERRGALDPSSRAAPVAASTIVR
jgi:zinc/manganese transport system permease protein